MKRKFQLNETFGSVVGSFLINIGILFLFALILTGTPKKPSEVLVEIEPLPMVDSGIKGETASRIEGNHQSASGQVSTAKDFSFRPRFQEQTSDLNSSTKIDETGRDQDRTAQRAGQEGSNGLEGTDSGNGTGTGESGGNSGMGGSGTGSGVKQIDWRGQFIQRVENNKQYPIAAQRRNITGTTQLQIVISPNGNLLVCNITASSGNEALDQAALKAVRASIPFQHEAGENLNLTIRIRFDVVGSVFRIEKEC